MALILNIDTSTEYASICIADNEIILALLSNNLQKEHGAWLHPAIMKALIIAGKKIGDLEAVGITTGPGSYTGLRIGMSTAKGICYAMGIPLVGANTLESMAQSAVKEDGAYLCPMIDARRMEVYTALYSASLKEVVKPAALILSKDSFQEQLAQQKIIFFGNGAEKFKNIISGERAIFINNSFDASNLSTVIYNKFVRCEYLSLAYSEPLYLK